MTVDHSLASDIVEGRPRTWLASTLPVLGARFPKLKTFVHDGDGF